MKDPQEDWCTCAPSLLTADTPLSLCVCARVCVCVCVCVLGILPSTLPSLAQPGGSSSRHLRGRSAATRGFAERGATVVIADWNRTAGENAVKSIPGDVRYLYVDLSSLAATRAFVGNFTAAVGKDVSILINNAAGPGATNVSTADGFVEMFEINYLAPFLLTELLLPGTVCPLLVPCPTMFLAPPPAKAERADQGKHAAARPAHLLLPGHAVFCFCS